MDEKFKPIVLEVDGNGLRIKAGEHYLISEDWYVFSSKDKTIDDLLTCRNFDEDDREKCAKANQAQLELFKLAAAAHDMYDALELALCDMEYVSKNHPEITGLAIRGEAIQKAKAALSKAKRDI